MNDHHVTSTNEYSFIQDPEIIFRTLQAKDVEAFYAGYHNWMLKQRIEALRVQTIPLRTQIEENAIQEQAMCPSAIALATLARLQSQGVDDIDLLDTMLERGDEWLDHAMQLLEQCERLGFINEDYTQWCEHALEGAYDWIESMTEIPDATTNEAQGTILAPEKTVVDTPSSAMTEALLLQKLMTDDEIEKLPTIVLPTEQKPEFSSSVTDTSLTAKSQSIQDEEMTTNAKTPDTDTSASSSSIVHTEKSSRTKHKKRAGLLAHLLLRLYK